MVIDKALNYKEQVTALLISEKLPVADLPGSLADFLVAIINSEVIGVVGTEVYGKYALLRSLTVHPEYRSLDIANKLIASMEALCSLRELTDRYLLTKTAQEYFKGKGFVQIARTDVPAEVQASSEFSHVCPVSAIVMSKHLNYRT